MQKIFIALLSTVALLLLWNTYEVRLLKTQMAEKPLEASTLKRAPEASPQQAMAMSDEWLASQQNLEQQLWLLGNQLNTLSQQLHQSQSQATEAAKVVEGKPPLTEAERLRDQGEGANIDSIIASGHMSQADSLSLQQSLGRMSEEAHMDAVRRIIVAMNKGELTLAADAHF